MKQLFIIVSISLSSIFVYSQNLIPNPSFESYSNCPETLGDIEQDIDSWQSYRGTPDYFNSCSESEFLGWDNSAGFQQPRTGNGYLGQITHHIGLPNAREYFGIELMESLVPGQTYYLTFYASLGFQESSSIQNATNNIGCLLMTDNYLDPSEQGEVPSFSHFNENTLVSDSANWVVFTKEFVADSAYSYLAVGNFYTDDQTEVLFLIPEDSSGGAYYYFDDFCLTTNPEGCELTNKIKEPNEISLTLYPNPTEDFLEVSSQGQVSSISIFDPIGRKVRVIEVNTSESHSVDVRDLDQGIYFLTVVYNKGKFKSQSFVKN